MHRFHLFHPAAPTSVKLAGVAVAILGVTWGVIDGLEKLSSPNSSASRAILGFLVFVFCIGSLARGIVRLSGFAYWMFLFVSALVALAGLVGVVQGNVILPQNLPLTVEEWLEMTILLPWGLSVLLLVLPSSMKAFWGRLGTPPREGAA